MTDTASDTIEDQAPAAQELQSFFRLKPESLAALQDGGYDTVDDITLLAQDLNFPSNLDFIPVPQDRLTILNYIKKSSEASVLFVSPAPPVPPSHKPV